MALQLGRRNRLLARDFEGILALETSSGENPRFFGGVSPRWTIRKG
jgi:hypothetical protein